MDPVSTKKETKAFVRSIAALIVLVVIAGMSTTTSWSVAQAIEIPDSTVRIGGTITDQVSKQPIPDVNVSISDRFGGGILCNPISDEKGRYFCEIPAGVNRGRVFIRINQSGYHAVEYNAWSEANRTINFRLSKR